MRPCGKASRYAGAYFKEKRIVNEFDVHELEDRIEFGLCGGGGSGGAGGGGGGGVCDEHPEVCQEE